jgi:hypothetical protein
MEYDHADKEEMKMGSARLSREDWERLDELLGKHGWGGYYDLVECLRIVAGDLGITSTGIELYPEREGAQARGGMSLPQIVKYLQDWAGLISKDPEFPSLVERVAKGAERVKGQGGRGPI